MLLPVAFLVLKQANLTVTFAPTPLPKALEILSKASGRNLDSAPALADEVVLACLKNAPTKTALNHLAEAMCAKWVDRPGGILRLMPDPAAERKLEDAKDAQRVQDFYTGLNYIKKRLVGEPAELDANDVKATAAKQAIEDKRSEVARANDDLEHMFQGGSAEEESPAWRLTAQTVLSLNPKTLLDLPEDAQEVWAENPTPMQHAFPDGSEPLLARYRRELSLTKPNASVARVKITMRREGTELWALFSALDTSGKRLEREVIGVSTRLIWSKLPLSQRANYVAPSNDKPVELPEDARAARIALAEPLTYRKTDQPTAILKCRPKFLDPVKFEPTQWHVGEDLVLAAEATGKNLIGTVSDHIGGMFYFAGAQGANALKPTPSQILGHHQADLMPSSDGWLVVRSGESTYRASRSKAKAFLEEGVRVGGITVDAAADWVSQSTESNPVYDWMWDYLHVLFSGPSSSSSAWDGRSLKLWASLGQGTIGALKDGQTVQLSTLSPDALSKIAQGVFWYRWLDDASADPTDLLPNGITDGTLTMTVTESTVMHGTTEKEDPRAAINTFNIDNIGRSEAVGETYFRTIQRWQLGVHRSYDLHFLLNPGKVPMTISLEETIFDPNGHALTRLPDSVLAQIEKARLYAIAHPQPPGEYPPSAPPVKKAVPPPYPFR